MQYFRPTVETMQFARDNLYMNPPSTNEHLLVWQLEMAQREADRSRFPDYANLYGEYDNHPGWRQDGLAREAISQGSIFTVPYRGSESITTAHSHQRVGIDEPATNATFLVFGSAVTTKK
jgi:hypothetical protein